ncbi:MAG: tyrosine--tRNA ligase, partial [Acidimicrobiia bacterium]
IGPQLESLLDFSEGPTQAVLVDNRTWTEPLSTLEFLRDVGKHITVNTMLAKESVKARVESESGISFTEFSYMLLQAFDFWWLHRHRGCELQVGGSDQWGNILSGVDLIRRRGGGAAHGLSWPLLTAADGSKLGKTTGARIWLDPARTSPYQLYQHFVRTDDRQVRQFLAWFTLLPVGEIDGLVADHEAEPGRRCAQRALAREVTALVHGDEAAAAAVYASAILFGGSPGDASSATLATVAAEVPAHTVSRDSLRAGLDLVPVLVGLGLAASRSDAARKIDQGGVYVNNVRAGTGRVVGADDILAGGHVLIRRGKQYGMMRVTEGTEVRVDVRPPP